MKQGLDQEEKQKPAGFSFKNNIASQHWSGLDISECGDIILTYLKSFFFEHQPMYVFSVFQEFW